MEIAQQKPRVVWNERATGTVDSLRGRDAMTSRDELAIRKNAPEGDYSTSGFEPSPLVVSIVMPCLNEAETIAGCVAEAQQALRDSGLAGEVVIADNGSTDGSQTIATQCGARVVKVLEKGYGSALRGGIAACRGEFIVMADADGSYDFSHAPRFVEKLQQGYDLVMGNRFAGGIEKGAMPWKHRYLGNPVLSGIGRLFFRCPVGDFHCGLRGFRRDAFARWRLTTTGMEFASEMVIKATIQGMRVTEIATVLRPDGRSRPPHLRSWRDGWRHLRFMLLFCPRWLFVIPATVSISVGLLLMALIAFFGAWRVGGVGFSTNTQVAGAMLVIVGFQTLFCGAFARQLSAMTRLLPANRTMLRLQRRVTLEVGLVLGILVFTVGLGLLASALWAWRSTGYGVLYPALTQQRVIPSVTLMILGVQTVFGSFLLSVIRFCLSGSVTERGKG